MKKSTLFLFVTALIGAVLMNSCWDIDTKNDPIIVIYAQTGALTAGTQGVATFLVITANIDNMKAGSVQWYSDAEGLTSANAPAGITTSLSTGNDQRTLTVNTTSDSQQGTYYFRVTIDGIQPFNTGMLTIDASTAKSVAVGLQS